MHMQENMGGKYLNHADCEKKHRVKICHLLFSSPEVVRSLAVTSQSKENVLKQKILSY